MTKSSRVFVAVVFRTLKIPIQKNSSVTLCFFPLYQNREKGQVFTQYATRGILTSLTANTEYKIWMTASTADKEGERSNVITVQTCKRPKNTPDTY